MVEVVRELKNIGIEISFENIRTDTPQRPKTAEFSGV